MVGFSDKVATLLAQCLETVTTLTLLPERLELVREGCVGTPTPPPHPCHPLHAGSVDRGHASASTLFRACEPVRMRDVLRSESE